MLGHVMLCLAVRYGSSIRQVAGSRHVVFGCAVPELFRQVAAPRHVVFGRAVLELG
jgi:hypothetical protein